MNSHFSTFFWLLCYFSPSTAWKFAPRNFSAIAPANLSSPSHLSPSSNASIVANSSTFSNGFVPSNESIPASPTLLPDPSLALVATLPNCALVCLATSVAQSPCSPTNTTCVCTNFFLEQQITLCITSSCTIKQSLTAKNITSQICHDSVRDKRDLYNVISSTLATISWVTVFIRLISKVYIRKYISKNDFGMDDYLVVLLLLLGTPSSVITTQALTPNGLGRDIWTVSFTQITRFIHAFYVMEVLYFAELAILKTSLLFFYLRIFPGNRIRKLIWGTIWLNVVYGVIFVFIGLFQCAPISYYWKNWDGEHQGRCFNVNAIGWSNAIISILLDFWMLALPMSQIVRLNLHWKKKIGVAAMFFVGTFVTVISIVRLQALLKFANSQNPTWDNFLTSLWSTIEINTGIICTCMPQLRLILVHCFPKLDSPKESAGKRYQDQQNYGAEIPIGHFTKISERNGLGKHWSEKEEEFRGEDGEDEDANVDDRYVGPGLKRGGAELRYGARDF